MVTCSGSLATINCELRQVRKEATVAAISGAGVWLGRVATLISLLPGCNPADFFGKLYRCFYYVTIQAGTIQAGQWVFTHELSGTGAKMAPAEFSATGWPGACAARPN